MSYNRRPKFHLKTHQQSAQKFTDTESNFKTLLSSTHTDNINTNLLQDYHKPLPSPSLKQRNTKDPINEPSKLTISEEITRELFKSFCLFLDKKAKQETTAHNQERDKNTRPLLTQATDIHTSYDSQPQPNDSRKNHAQTYGHTETN